MTSKSERSADPSASGVLNGQRAAVVVFSHYPSDPRPRRAAEALVQAGMAVDVISICQDESDPRQDSCNGVSIRRIPLKHTRGGKVGYVARYGAFILAAFVLLAFRSLTRRYRLVHVHNMPDVLVLAALIPKLLGARVILDLHDPMPELMMTIFGLRRESFGVRLLQSCERWSIVLADAVLTPNAAFEKLFVSRGCPPRKIGVVMNSPDEDIFKFREPTAPAQRDDARPFVVMYHGAIVERHGLDLAVQAIEQLRETVPNIRLHIYGRSTPFLETVLEMARTRGLQQEVRYFGAKSLHEIAKAIDDCDVGIIPNRQSLFTELNLPTRIFEYLARGKAVVAPGTPGIRDYFSEGELRFFKLGDADDLARQLRAVALQPVETYETVKRGQAVYYAHKWSAERLRFLALVQRLIVKPAAWQECQPSPGAPVSRNVFRYAGAASGRRDREAVKR